MIPSTEGEDMADPEGVAGVERKAADIANAGPPFWANKFIVASGHVVRITFLEQGGPTEPLFFRTAVVVSHQDAIALKNLGCRETIPSNAGRGRGHGAHKRCLTRLRGAR